jgi:hypothetical protein
LAAFWRASDSFALGNNTRLIAGYMAQLVSDDGQEVPRYIVTGEKKKKHVQESARGYRVKRDVLDDDLSSLVSRDAGPRVVAGRARWHPHRAAAQAERPLPFLLDVQDPAAEAVRRVSPRRRWVQ